MSRFKFELVIASMLGLMVPAVAPPARAQTSGLTTVEDTATTSPNYYGLHFDLGIFDGSGLNSVGQNYRNELSFYFEPSWDIGRHFSSLSSTRWKSLQLAGRFIVTSGLAGVDDSYFSGQTNAGAQGGCGGIQTRDNGGQLIDGTVPYCNPAAANRRADYSDVWLTLRAPGIYKIPKAEININPAFRVVLPASAQSRFATLIMAITPSLGLSRKFWKDRIGLGVSFGVTKNFHTKAAKEFQGSSIGGDVALQGGNPYDGAGGASLSGVYADDSRRAGGGRFNTNFSLQAVISGNIKFNDKWTFDALYILTDYHPYDGGLCLQNIDGVGMVDTCKNGDAVAASSGSALNRPGNHQRQIFWATLNYQPWEWMGFSLAWINDATLLRDDSSYRQGFISTNYDAFTTISLGTTISIDHVADAIRKRKKAKVTSVASSNAVTLQ